MRKGIYKNQKDNTWYIATKIKVNDKYKTCTIRGFNSKQEANDNYDNAIAKWKRKHNVFAKNDEYNKVVDEYISYRSKLVRKSSLNKDITQFKYYSIIFDGNNLNQLFNEIRLKVIYSDIINNEQFSSQKKMRLVLAFREFSKFCYLSQYINQDTYNMVSMIFLPIKEEKQERKDKRIILISHFKALMNEINKVNDNLYSLAIFVLYSCGLRISELLGLYVSDIDLENKVIKVQRQLLTNGEISTTLKTSNSYRSVPITSKLLNELCNYLQKTEKNISITSKSFEQIRLFPYSHTSFKRKLAMYEANAKTPNYSCHEFRHTRCYELAKKCENMSDVVYCAKVMGHSVSVYLNTYCSHIDNSLDNKFFN